MLDPVIFAFEASSAHYILTHLGVEPTDVNLTPIRPQPQNVSSATSASTPRTNWTLVTIASGHYPKLVTLRQDWNADSAQLVESTLSPYGPVAKMDLISTEQQPLTEQSVKGFLTQVANAVQSNHTSSLSLIMSVIR